MDWDTLLTLSLAGLAASMGVVVFTVVQAFRYQSWLPKRDTADSLEALKLQLEERREEWERLHANAAMARADIEQAQEAREQITELREQVATLDSKKREYEEVVGRLESARSELEDLEGRVAVQKHELIPEADYRSMLERQRKLDLELPELESRKIKLDQEISGLDAEQGRIRDEVEVMRSSRGDLEEALNEQRTEVAAMRAEGAGLEQRKFSLEKQIDDLLATKAAVGGSGAEQDSDHATELLWQPALLAGDFAGVAQEEQDEQSVLEDVRERIRGQNFVYHERVVKAFHTSLKCAQDAPLTVLAGISGTGKSALPTRYARAIGMHLQTVPVQPGWDSPADLLGFYNHLEGRFRPTELMRALIQMDYVHSAGGGEGGARAAGSWPVQADERSGLSDQMLLVLLDEMNLARVEYYFSEFLSRLELRHGVDESSESERRQAELVLDLGSAGVDVSQELRVFVGRNVLFVGTMNEDESTQTLSDKVVDRSNVMRFGRPRKLHISGAAHSVALSKPRALQRATWSRWIERATLREDDERRVDGWIESLNEALAEIGRPFAYRVSEAMRSYVKLYPGQSARDLNDAMADQVELRILPRLRGLDMHDPNVVSSIGKVQGLVADKLEDEMLAAALDDARSLSGDQLFQWSGLDRTATESSVVH